MSRHRSLSTPFHKYNDVCWERDGDQIEARRRVDARASARRSNKEMGPSRPNPSGGWGLRAISLSFVVNDANASPPPLFATSPRKTHPQTSSYLWKGVLSLFLAIPFVLISTAQGSERKVAESKQEIRPVLPGQPIPDVTFVTMEGDPVKLREVVSQRPVVPHRVQGRVVTLV